MKLFDKYNRINLLATIAIFLLAGVAFYFSLRHVLIGQLDESLVIEQNEIEQYVNRFGKLPELMPVEDQHVVYIPVYKPAAPMQFLNKIEYDPVEKAEENFRQLIFSIKLKEQLYKVEVSTSLEATEALAKSIILVTFFTILTILITTTFINRILLTRLWRPFFIALQSLNEIKLGQKNNIQFKNTNVEEFITLNKALQQFVDKAGSDFRTLKEFTENASHELQTPLAVIRSRLDLLVQDENLSQQQSEAAQSAYEAIQKLSRLNQSMLLLAKIENGQFEHTGLINLKEKIEEKQQEFREVWQNKSITIHTQLEKVSIRMNNELSEVLLNNLLSNATRHNIHDGEINIELNHSHLKIVNTGASAMLNIDKLFTRFHKESATGSHGLGLSIIKQICDASNLSVMYSYSYSHRLHQFIIFLT